MAPVMKALIDPSRSGVDCSRKPEDPSRRPEDPSRKLEAAKVRFARRPPGPLPAPTAQPPSGTQPSGKQNLSAFIWSVADLLRGDYKQSDYGKVTLPFTVLRRLDCVLEPSKEAVLIRKGVARKPGARPRTLPAASGGAGLLQHLSPGHEAADGRPGQHRQEPA